MWKNKKEQFSCSHLPKVSFSIVACSFLNGGCCHPACPHPCSLAGQSCPLSLGDVGSDHTAKRSWKRWKGCQDAIWVSASAVQSSTPLAGLSFQWALSLTESSISSAFFLNHKRLWLINPSDLTITIPKKSPATHCSPWWGSCWPGLDLQGQAC